MNRSLKFALIFVALLFISKTFNSDQLRRKKMIFEAIYKKYGANRLGKFAKVYEALESLKLSDLQFKLALIQIMQETGVFASTSKVYDLNTNASGITFSGSEAQLKTGAIKGSLRPTNEGGNYAKYPTLRAWAVDYLRILNKGVFPLTAKTPLEFAQKLKQNKYYTDSVENYSKNLNFYYNLINK